MEPNLKNKDTKIDITKKETVNLWFLNFSLRIRNYLCKICAKNIHVDPYHMVRLKKVMSIFHQNKKQFLVILNYDLAI